MYWWQALILGIVEGLTEYLPVSSTGHLILVSQWLGLNASEGQKQAVDSFNIIIQAGAIVAVLGLYRARVMQMGRGVLGKDREGLGLLLNLLIAFLPAAVLGLLFHKQIKLYLFGPWPVVGALFAGALLMIVVDRSRKLQAQVQEQSGQSIIGVTWQMALFIGFAQCVAMWPGTSRSMMTIVAAIFLGLKRKDAAEFSFLLGLITLGAATCYESLKSGQEMIEQIPVSSLLIGFVAAGISAGLAVKWFVAFLTQHGLASFAYYRIGLAVTIGVLVYGSF